MDRTADLVNCSCRPNNLFYAEMRPGIGIELDEIIIELRRLNLLAPAHSFAVTVGRKLVKMMGG